MHLLLIFALTFTLSAQQDYKDGTNEESTENGSEMMKKVMNAIGEKAQEQIMNGLDDYNLEQLIDCIENDCEMNEFRDLMQKMVDVLKRISHGDKLIYKIIKAVVKDGLLAEMINNLSEEHTLEIINALNAREIGKLMNMDSGDINISKLTSIGKKIIPIIKKAKGGKGLSKLINMFTSDEEEKKALPYHHPVPDGLRTGMSVYMQGTVSKHAKRFHVCFACCHHEGADITIDFSPRFDIGKTVLATSQDGKWGKEEHHEMPFQKGEKFEVIFIVNNTGYQILVNRKPYCTYGHRIPPQNMREIRVDGDLELQSLNVMGGPRTGNLIFPYHQPVPGGLHPGMSVHVEGRVPKLLKGFPVYFQMNLATNTQNMLDIPLHFTPTYIYNHIGLNTLQNNRWGREDKRKMVLQESKNFEIIFIVNEDQYQVLINGKFFCTYKHIIPPQRVRDINVYGNVQLHSLIVMGGPTMGNLVMTGPAIYYPPVPYTYNISEGLGANKTITVRGSILKNAKRFEIKFMAGQDIALSISTHMEKRIVVCNSFLKGQWGLEERNLLFKLFQPGKYFELSIHCEHHKFKVYANGQPFFNYTHRYVPTENIRNIKISGDVTLSYIKY